LLTEPWDAEELYPYRWVAVGSRSRSKGARGGDFPNYGRKGKPENDMVNSSELDEGGVVMGKKGRKEGAAFSYTAV